MTAPVRRALTTTDRRLVTDLLWGIWRARGCDSIDRWVLAMVLTELGYRLRHEGIEPTPELIADLGGWLNSPLECPWALEPPPTVRLPWWRRWRRGR